MKTRITRNNNNNVEENKVEENKVKEKNLLKEITQRYLNFELNTSISISTIIPEQTILPQQDGLKFVDKKIFSVFKNNENLNEFFVNLLTEKSFFENNEVTNNEGALECLNIFLNANKTFNNCIAKKNALLNNKEFKREIFNIIIDGAIQTLDNKNKNKLNNIIDEVEGIISKDTYKKNNSALLEVVQEKIGKMGWEEL